MMLLPRRRVLHLAAGATVLSAASRIARAQDYPTRLVRIIVGFAPGGSADILARLIGRSLSDRLGRPFVIENRIGAGNNIATEAVVKAPADGYTLLLITSANAINASLYDRLAFDFIRDIAPVANIAILPYVLLVTPSFPAKSVSELIAYAKAHPAQVTMASAGNGTVPHLAGELFQMMAGIQMIHVPYRGGAPALTDLLAGQVQVMFGTTPDALVHVKAGRLRALAVATAKPLDVLPDLPPLTDFLPGYEASAFHGIGTPARTPAAIVDRLNREINAVLADVHMRARLAEFGTSVAPGSPADFARLIAEQTVKWAKVVKSSGTKPT